MSQLKTKLTTWWSRVRGQDQTIENPPARLTRTQRDNAIHSLQEGYHELLQLMSAVRIHLDKQSDRSDRMLSLMEHLPDALKALPETNRNQARMLEAIEEHLEDQRRAGKEMNESMSGLATSADRQVQIMTAMHQQFDSRTETDQQMAKSLGSLNGALQNLNTSSEASLRFLSDLAERNDRTQQELAGIVQRNRRHTTILAGTSCGILVLGVAAIAMGFFGGPATPPAAAPTLTQGEPAADVTRIETVGTPAPVPVEKEDLLHGFGQLIPEADAAVTPAGDGDADAADEPTAAETVEMDAPLFDIKPTAPTGDGDADAAGDGDADADTASMPAFGGDGDGDAAISEASVFGGDGDADADPSEPAQFGGDGDADLDPAENSTFGGDGDADADTDSMAADEMSESEPATDPAPVEESDAAEDSASAPLPDDATDMADFQWLESEPDAPVTLTPAVIETD